MIIAGAYRRTSPLRRVPAPVYAALALGAVASAQPLPTDPDLVTGALDNGLRYVVLEHDHPPGRVELRLQVDTGSLNETDEQRGVAHFLEHMAFNGSERFPPGSVIPLFESLGLTFGQHQNASTGFDQTVYSLSLQDTGAESLEQAMRFLSDVAFALTFPPEEIERERGVILEEKRARSGGMQRVMDRVLTELSPGSLLGERVAIGTDESIQGMQREDFLDYYRRWYVPSNMAVVVVGDVPPGEIVERIERHFGRGHAVPTPTDQDPGVTPTRGRRAVIVQDPEVVRAEITLVRLRPPPPPAATVEALRAELVDQLGSTAFTERMRDVVAEGSAPFLRAGASSSVQFKAFHAAQASASGEPARWRDMLIALAGQIERARRFGLSEEEIERQKKELRTAAQQRVRTAATRPSAVLAGELVSRIAAGRALTSPAQELELIESLLPQITPDQVNARFRDLYDFSDAVVIVQAPSSVGSPDPSEALGALERVLTGPIAPPTPRARASALMDRLPEPGTLLAWEDHPGCDASSAWLSNGVRLHYCFNDYKQGQVTVVIRLAGGAIEETADNRGISQAAARAWQTPATSEHSSSQIRELMAGAESSVSGGAREDTMDLRIAGTGDFEQAFQLAYLLLTEPVLEPTAFDTWRQGQLQQIQMIERTPMMAFLDRFVRTLYPEPRMRPILTRPEVEALSRDAAQAWLERIIAAAPIEVTVVGDIPRDRAEELVLRYVGSLPPRARIGPDTLADLRRVERPAGPRVVDERIETPTDQAIVFVGFYAADADDLLDTWRLGIARRVLTSRMTRRLREEEALVYSISASVSASPAWPGFGTFYASAPTDPDKADTLAARIAEMFADFARSGPTDEEMDVAREQALRVLETTMPEPSFWVRALSDLTYRGGDLSLLLDQADAHRHMTAGDVQEAFARYFTPDRTFTILLRPR